MTEAPASLLLGDDLHQQHAGLWEDIGRLQMELDHQLVHNAQLQRLREQEQATQALARDKAKALQTALYHIAERATASLSLHAFSRIVHELLSGLIVAKNCFVCLYNATHHTLDFPYYIDERDGHSQQLDHVPYRRGLTEFVLHTGRAQLIDAKRFATLQRSGDITQATGDLTFTQWLGVPLLIRGTVGGVLAVQTYTFDKGYSSADIDILTCIANHFSSAIERYQAIQELRKSEQRYRTVIDNIKLGMMVIQDAQVVFANPSMVRISGQPMDSLLLQPFSTLFHPNDAPEALDVCQRCAATHQPKHPSTLRILTAQRGIRWVELSAVALEWNARPAILAFAIDTSERHQIAQAQREALSQQSELNEMKTGFISMASHELRTPLSAIHGSMELLRHYDARLNPQQRESAIEKIDAAAHRMLRMLDNLALIDPNEATQHRCRAQPVALTMLCHHIIEELQTLRPDRFQPERLQLCLPPPEQLFPLDEVLVRRILGNLLSNAFKYTPNGAQVALSAHTQDHSLVLVVADHGVGIPEADLDHLFERFFRASNAGTVRGTGLGLSIVKDAVHAHAGHIAVRTQVGVGSCFTVTLALQEAA